MAQQKSFNAEPVILRNVRLSFPNLYRKSVFEGTESNKWDATFMIDNQDPSHAAAVKQLLADKKACIENALKGRKPEFRYDALKSPKMRDAAGKERPEYEGAYTLKAGTKTRPITVDAKNQIVTEDDGVFYPGCRVNAKVRLYGFASKYGPQIGANLLAVQFAGDDEPLGDGVVSFEEAVEGFDADETKGGDDPFGGEDDEDDDIPF